MSHLSFEGNPIYEIDLLRQQLAEKDAEIERLEFSLQRSDMECVCAKRQAAASQVREQRLREALKAAAGKFHDYAEYHSMKERTRDNIEKIERNMALARMCDEALALPQDTSALEAVVQRAGEVMRERCADTAEDHNGKRGEHDGSAIAHLIRAIPAVTMEDLK